MCSAPDPGKHCFPLVNWPIAVRSKIRFSCAKLMCPKLRAFSSPRRENFQAEICTLTIATSALMKLQLWRKSPAKFKQRVSTKGATRPPRCQYDDAATLHADTALASDCRAPSGRAVTRSSSGMSHLCDSSAERQCTGNQMRMSLFPLPPFERTRSQTPCPLSKRSGSRLVYNAQ